MWTWPIVLTLCISVLALCVAGGSLWWQIRSWRRSGPRVTVAARSAATPEGGCIVIEATNSGRMATEIGNCGFDLPNGRHIQNPMSFFGVPHALPAQLAVGGKVSFYYSPEGLQVPLVGEGLTGEDVRPYAETGHGRIKGPAVHLGKMITATSQK